MITLYHNPRCSKSRDALTLLEQHGQPFQIVEYLKTPLDEGTLSALLVKLGLTAREIMRNKEDEYQQLGLADSSLTEQQLISAMVKHPRLLERPIVVTGDKAAIGRPLANIAAIL
ncbi:arsenate reductase [Alishewanella longhuensis]|uniref:Arsenate reductase n=1 Tax=Alishewanella longhuensis TaxID=1091037 RepID=A0ABQ3L001_9ALTE|nr:arsenate reductase (glutaredoxin) [Alishewanella longhuensis]GHG70961.1 arsenate reductase [Alishewanella longhuensis]